MNDVTPLRADADWFAVIAERGSAGELQLFYEANPQYWQLTHGRPPQPSEAAGGLDFRPPPDMKYTALSTWLIRARASKRIIGEVSVATDLLAPGVTHLGGRLIFPLTPNEGLGCILLVTRCESGAYHATVVTRAAFIPCIGARDDATSDSFAAALETRPIWEIRSLRRDGMPDETAWCAGEDWWLSTAEAA